VNNPVPLGGSEGGTPPQGSALEWKGGCQAGKVRKAAGKSAAGAEPVMAGLRATSDRRGGRETPLSDERPAPVPQTDTGGEVENTTAHERTLVKELGKMAP
jgi:hypothetical protein